MLGTLLLLEIREELTFASSTICNLFQKAKECNMKCRKDYEELTDSNCEFSVRITIVRRLLNNPLLCPTMQQTRKALDLHLVPRLQVSSNFRMLKNEA